MDIYNELLLPHGHLAPHYNTVVKWAKLFREGRESIEDDPRSGRPLTSFIDTNIELVRQVIDANPHATYDEIEEETSINRYTIQEIIHVALELRKISSRYVPHIGSGRLCDILTGDEVIIYWRQLGHKSSNASWLAKDAAPKTIVKRSQFDRKTMFSIFF